MSNLQIEPRHLKIVEEILEAVPCEIYIFGSRSKGTARPLSDLDLAFKGPISGEQLSRIREAFEESDLPYKVDIVVWETLDPDFKQHIERDLQPFLKSPT